MTSSEGLLQRANGRLKDMAMNPVLLLEVSEPSGCGGRLFLESCWIWPWVKIQIPVNIPIQPLTSRLRVVNSPTPKWDPMAFEPPNEQPGLLKMEAWPSRLSIPGKTPCVTQGKEINQIAFQPPRQIESRMQCFCQKEGAETMV